MKSNATYVSFFCREYWGTSACKAQLSLERFDWSDRLKRQVQQACVLESLSLAVASSLCSGTMQEVSVAVRSRLSNLLYYVHENCLVLIDLLRNRLRLRLEGPNAELEAEAGLPHGGELNFDILVRANRYRQLRKGEHVLALKQHNEMVANIAKQLCRAASTKTTVTAPTSARPRGSMSPGSPGPGSGPRSGARTATAGARGAAAAPGGVLRAVGDILSGSMPLDRLRPRSVHSSMLAYTRFQPLLNIDGVDPDCPWPSSDPYNRFGAKRLATEGPIIWFEPLPPMMADLEDCPCLPPPPSADSYSLVLDLDETLVHYFEKDGVGSYGIRPGMTKFLERMHAVGYEIVIFTAATQDYADWVIGQIDPTGLIHHRLYRQNALPWGPLFAKDLSRLGRDLERTLIIDNVQENFMLQPNHGIFISTWYDNPLDTALMDLTPMLEELIVTRVRVPDMLERYREQIPLWSGFGREQWEDDAGLEASYDSVDIQQDDYGIQPPYHGENLAPPQQPAAPAATAPAVSMRAAQSPPYVQQSSNLEVAAGPPMESQMQAALPQAAPQQRWQPQQQPPQSQQQPQQWAQRTTVPATAAGTGATPTPPRPTFSAIAGPYQASQSAGIAGPYQAAQSTGTAGAPAPVPARAGIQNYNPFSRAH